MGESSYTGKVAVVTGQEREPPDFVPEIEVVIGIKDIYPGNVKRVLRTEWVEWISRKNPWYGNGGIND